MAHRSARLSVFSRQLLVDRVIVLGKPVAMVATELGISRATGYKWVRRYRTEGAAGLADRSSRPHRSPRALAREQVEAILAARVAYRFGPHRLAYLTGHSRSTISDVLARAGMSRLADADKLTGAPVRYVACHPGALLHQDHKKLGRIPDGGGHRATGRGAGYRHSGLGYDHFEIFIDDATRLGFVALVDDERPASAVDALQRAAAFYAARGMRIERVLTDNGGAYRSRVYAAALDELGARHKRTRPYRPQTNGKVERLIKTLLAEWAYARPYRSNDERLEALPDWLDFYNHGRPHTALDGLTPHQALVNNVGGHHS
ncbi:IS481 family transposase [soil metagenome]